MKTAIIIVKYNTPNFYIDNLRKELNKFEISGSYYVIDNTKSNKGFAAAVNEGINLGIKDKCDFF